MKHLLPVVAVCTAFLSGFSSLVAQSLATQEREPLQHTFTSSSNRQMQVSLVEVTYPAGGSSKPHTHSCPVVGYVVSGALRMKVAGEPEKLYKSGDAFYEEANKVHEVSANASQSVPAKFVAYFICENEKPLSEPVANGVKQ